jgi:hypothetical protein
MSANIDLIRTLFQGDVTRNTNKILALLADEVELAETSSNLVAEAAALTESLGVNSQKISSLASGTVATDAANLGQVLQPVANPQGAGYALAAADIGNVVFATGAGAQAFTLPDLSASLISGRTMLITIQCEGAATAVTITPGGSSQIDGAGVGVAFVGTTGRSRISLLSRDGLNWFSGTP